MGGAFLPSLCALRAREGRARLRAERWTGAPSISFCGILFDLIGGERWRAAPARRRWPRRDTGSASPTPRLQQTDMGPGGAYLLFVRFTRARGGSRAARSIRPELWAGPPPISFLRYGRLPYNLQQLLFEQAGAGVSKNFRPTSPRWPTLADIIVRFAAENCCCANWYKSPTGERTGL